MSEDNKSATILYVRGLPGSGKSHLAHALAQSFPQDSVVSLDPDAIELDSTEYASHVAAMREAQVDEKLFEYRFLRAQAYRGIEEGKIIIWNQPFTNLEIFNKMVGRMQEHAAECGVRLRILVVEVNVDPAVAKQRVDERIANGGHGPSDDTFARFVRDYKTFADSGYKTIPVNGDANVAESITRIHSAITE